MCLLDLFREMGDGGGSFKMACTYLGGSLLGGSNAE